MTPTPAAIRAARTAAELTQIEAAALARCSAAAWQSAELGRRRIDPAAWELFLLRTGQHPTDRVARRRGTK